MKITSVVSQFTLEVTSVVGIKSAMTVTLEAQPDDHETWTMDEAKHAHIVLAEQVVKEVFTSLTAEGALTPPEAKAQMAKMTERFKVIRAKREQALAEIMLNVQTEEVVNAY